jgi:hypothetical protein
MAISTLPEDEQQQQHDSQAADDAQGQGLHKDQAFPDALARVSCITGHGLDGMSCANVLNCALQLCPVRDGAVHD